MTRRGYEVRKQETLSVASFSAPGRKCAMQMPISEPRKLKNLRQVILPYGDYSPHNDLLRLGVQSQFPPQDRTLGLG